MRRVKLAAAGVVLAVGLFFLGRALVVPVKAFLAPMWIEDAFEAEGDVRPPWRNADWVPVERLDMPTLGTRHIALEGAPQRAMAFGPVRVQRGEATLYFGHRDTHFAAIGGLKVGDPVELLDRSGQRRYYEVKRYWTATEDQLYLPGGGDNAGLLLITCYPFDAVRAGGPGRYLVWAEPVE